jgi:hypothetical protein
MNPYRTASDSSEDPADNRDMIFAVAVLLTASLARVIGAVALGETFGAEATLALLFTLACFAWGTRRVTRTLRRRRRAWPVA